MKGGGFNRRTRLDVVRGILLVGLAAAVGLYFTAAAPGPDPLGDPLQDSKAYQRTLEMYGGTANLVASQFSAWFKGLWQGRNLAYSVAVLTLALALGFWLVTGALLPPGADRERRR